MDLDRTVLDTSIPSPATPGSGVWEGDGGSSAVVPLTHAHAVLRVAQALRHVKEPGGPARLVAVVRVGTRPARQAPRLGSPVPVGHELVVQPCAPPRDGVPGTGQSTPVRPAGRPRPLTKTPRNRWTFGQSHLVYVYDLHSRLRGGLKVRHESQSPSGSWAEGARSLHV